MKSILGVIFLVAGGGYLGFSVVHTIHRRARGVGQLIQALGQLEREMSLSLTPLPQLFDTLSRGRGPVPQFFGHCHRGLEGGQPLAQCWEGGLDCLAPLGEDCVELVRPLGAVLGRYQSQAQAVAIQRVVHDLEALGQQLIQEGRRLGRVYPTLGLTGGAFLALALI